MKKSFFYLLLLCLLTACLLPKLFITLQSERSDNAVINSVKISDVSIDIQEYLISRQLKNIKILIFNDTFLMDKKNGPLMEKLWQNGYETGIILDLSSKSEDYFIKLSDILTHRKVHIVYFEDRNLQFDYNTFAKITEIIKENGAAIGLLENKEQNGLQYPVLEKYSSDIEGFADRALYTDRKDIERLSNREISFRLLRSVVDRRIRFNLLKADNLEDLKQYDDIVGILNSELISKGYTESKEASPVNTSPRSIIDLLVLLAFVVITIFSLQGAAEIKRKFALLFLAAFLTVTLTLYYYDYSLAMIFLTLTITIFVPPFVTITLYKYVTSNSCKCSFVRVLTVHGAAFTVYIISGLFIWLAFSDYIFRIGFITYKLALISYITPIIIILTYILRHDGYSLKSIKKALFNRKSVTIMLLSAAAAAVYLSRSGNFSLFPATPAELYFRMYLERILPVRPRLKEFLLGYPAFFMLFAVNKRKNKAAFSYLLIFSAITGISILNTFCHGFTAINVSLTRAFLGFVLGTLIGILTYFLFKTYSSDKTW